MNVYSLPYAGVSPKLSSPPLKIGEHAVVIGRVVLGENAWLGDFSVVRADGHFVKIGSDFYLGKRGTVHIAHEVYPTIIGDNVCAGDYAVVHACEISNNCVIGENAVVLDGSKVEANVILSDGSVVYPRTELKSGWLYSGKPAKPVCEIGEADIEQAQRRYRDKPSDNTMAHESSSATNELDAVFVSHTAILSGDIRSDYDSSIWYGCRLEAIEHSIRIGGKTNIQDNTDIIASKQRVVVGDRVTVGHNVQMSDCSIGNDCMVGIGAVVSPGTIIESDVLLAAGAVTEPDQILETGRIWAGNPARPRAKLNRANRRMMAETIPIYCEYGYQNDLLSSQHKTDRIRPEHK